MKRLVVIANPVCGKAQARIAVTKLQQAISDTNYLAEIYYSEYPAHAYELCRQLDWQEQHILVVVGGDGTAHDAINGLLDCNLDLRIPVAIVPCGTGNDFIAELGIETIQQGIDAILRGQVKSVDLGLVKSLGQQRYMLVCALWGYFCDLANFANRHRWLGPARYVIAGYAQFLLQRARKAKLEIDGNEILDEFLVFIAVNGRRAGNANVMSPTADMHDGKLDLLYFNKLSKFTFLKEMLQLQAGKIGHSKRAQLLKL